VKAARPHRRRGPGKPTDRNIGHGAPVRPYWFTQGLTLARMEIQRRPAEQRPPTHEPDLFRARFALLRRADHLTDAHQMYLGGLFDAHPQLRTAWDALQEPSANCTKPTT